MIYVITKMNYDFVHYYMMIVGAFDERDKAEELYNKTKLEGGEDVEMKIFDSNTGEEI